MIQIFIVLIMALGSSSSSFAQESTSNKTLEKRIIVLESEVKRLKMQEQKASKLYTCIKKIEGNYLTIPFKIMNCIKNS